MECENSMDDREIRKMREACITGMVKALGKALFSYLSSCNPSLTRVLGGTKSQ